MKINSHSTKSGVSLFHWLFHKLSNRQFLAAGAIVVGIWTGITAVLLKVVVHYLQQIVKGLGGEHHWIYLISPFIGISATIIFVRLVLNGELAKGTAHVLFAIARKSSSLPKKETYGHAATSALTIGFGGSAGLESPIVQTGAAVGSFFASYFPIGYKDRTLLLACGAAAGIGTAFNAPIAGVLFALEVLLVDTTVASFIPLLIAGATGAICSKIILSEGILLSFRNISDFEAAHIPYYAMLGIVCGLVASFYLRSFQHSESFFRKTLHSGAQRLLVGGMLLGGLIWIFPALFGEGYSGIVSMASMRPNELFEGSPLYELVTENIIWLGLAILAIGIVKVFAVSLTLNAGGNGGNFAPSLLVGACTGFSFAYLLNATGLTQLSTSNFCVVAMAGMLTGIFHSPLTAIFLIGEITGGYELMIPLMIVAALSTAVSKYLVSHSLDEARLLQTVGSGLVGRDAVILSQLDLNESIEKDFVPIRLGSNLKHLTAAIAGSKRNIFPVVDEHNVLRGVIALEDVREIMFNSDSYELKVDHLMRRPTVTTSINDDMNTVMEKFDKSGVWNIPVIDGDRYVGFISKSRIFSSYRDWLRKG